MAGRFVLTPAVGFLTAIQNALNDMKVTDMQDADFTGLANGDVLVWNSGTLKWEAGTAGGGVSDGATLSTGLTFPNTGLHLLDTDASHDLIIKPDSNLTADRTLSVVTGDSNRTLTMSGNADISGTNTGDQTSVSGNAGTATTLQTARKINGVSFNGSADIGVDLDILSYQALGSTIIAETLTGSARQISGNLTLGNQQLRTQAIYLPKDDTLDGVKWFQATQGDYTSNNYNGVGLWSYSGGTLTLVASSTDDGNIWKGASNTWQSKAFTTPYSATAGLYFIGFLWCRSAQVTAPTIGITPAIVANSGCIVDFTNSAKLSSTLASQTSLPASQAMSGLTATTAAWYMGIYT